MDNKILIEVYVPIIEKEYDVFVPINKKIKNLAKLINDAVIDLSNGTLINKSSGESKTFEPFNDFMLDILENGGLVNHYLNNQD